MAWWQNRLVSWFSGIFFIFGRDRVPTQGGPCFNWIPWYLNMLWSMTVWKITFLPEKRRWFVFFLKHTGGGTLRTMLSLNFNGSIMKHWDVNDVNESESNWSQMTPVFVFFNVFMFLVMFLILSVNAFRLRQTGTFLSNNCNAKYRCCW